MPTLSKHYSAERDRLTLAELCSVASIKAQEAFVAKLRVTDKEIELGERVDQRSPEWHALKKNRIGGSKMGQINNHDEPRTPMDAVHDMVVGGSGESSWMMKKGTIMENTVFDIVNLEIRAVLLKEGYEEAWLELTGIRVWKDHPWIAVSADAKVYATGNRNPAVRNGFIGIVEIKTPAFDRTYDEVKKAHYDQFMGTAAVHGVDRIWYAVYSPAKTDLYEFAFDEVYWRNSLFPTLQCWYFEQFMVRAIWNEAGLLAPDSINPPSIDLDWDMDLDVDTDARGKRPDEPYAIIDGVGIVPLSPKLDDGLAPKEGPIVNKKRASGGTDANRVANKHRGYGLDHDESEDTASVSRKSSFASPDTALADSPSDEHVRTPVAYTTPALRSPFAASEKLPNRSASTIATDVTTATATTASRVVTKRERDPDQSDTFDSPIDRRHDSTKPKQVKRVLVSKEALARAMLLYKSDPRLEHDDYDYPLSKDFAEPEASRKRALSPLPSQRSSSHDSSHSSSSSSSSSSSLPAPTLRLPPSSSEIQMNIWKRHRYDSNDGSNE